MKHQRFQSDIFRTLPAELSTRALRAALPIALASTSLGLCARTAHAQVVFSIDYRGPTIGVVSPAPITEGDILMPAPGLPAFGPLPPPFIAISGGFGPPGPGLGIPLHPGCMGHPPGMPCGVEVDALSYGTDYPIPFGALPAGTYVFSVDEWAVGIPGSPLAPNVLSESPVGDSAADIFEALGLPGGPLPPGGPAGNSGIIDGNGLVSGSGGIYPGLGLIEPTFPFFGPGPRPGDNVDALEMDSPAGPTIGVFFSLDGAFFDPLNGVPNTGSAAANGFLPGAILVTLVPGGPPVVYAPPFMLGLDLFGPGTDDLDALALWENGMPGFQPGGPYKWLAPTLTDMCLFSVRRGSAVIGVPDSTFGIPIEPGDILCPPPGPGLPPSIFIAAEWLGLATARSGFGMFGDDLDALDTRMKPQTGLPYCFGDGSGTACPCGNTGAPGHGCANSIYAAGGLLTATGVASVSADTVVLSGSSMPSSTALYFQGTAKTGVVLADGLSEQMAQANSSRTARDQPTLSPTPTTLTGSPSSDWIARTMPPLACKPGLVSDARDLTASAERQPAPDRSDRWSRRSRAAPPCRRPRCGRRSGAASAAPP